MGSMWMMGILLLLAGGQAQLLMNPRLEIAQDSEKNWVKFVNNIQEQVLNDTGENFDLMSMLRKIFVALKSSSFPTAVAHNISQQCLEDSQFYVRNLYANRTLWALQMQESTGDLPPGLFGSNNIHADGLFDECLAVRAPGFNGQYCGVFFQPVAVDQSEILSPSESVDNENQDERSNFITVFQLLGFLGPDRVQPKVSVADAYTYALPSVSFCLPSSCSASDLGQAVAELIGSYVIANYSLVTVTDEQYCFEESYDPPIFDGLEITVIVVFSLVGLLILSATVHETWRMFRGTDANQDGKLLSGLRCFSVLSNGRTILSMEVPTGADNFGCIHGLRFLSTCWVILGHTWSYVSYKTMNPKAVLTDAYGWGMQTIVNASVSVDTFFLLSGLLASYLLLRELDRNKGKFNVGLYYLHRYLRLTVVYAFILGFIATLIVYVSIGPNWYSVNLYSNACRIAWWRQFLYINNLYPFDPYYSCMNPTWYLAVDMQLFFVSPLLIYPLWRWRKWGLAWLAFVALACHAFIFYVYVRDDLPPSYVATRPDSNEYETVFNYFNHYYYKTWTRAPPYLVGIWAGWFLHITKNLPSRLSKLLVILGWTLSMAVALAIVYGLSPYVDQSTVPEISFAIKITYGPLHRSAWACVIAWIIFACSRGYGGFVNQLLSWKGFLPLGRLTYCVYLIHYDYLNVFYSAMRKQYYYTIFGQISIYFGVLVIVFGLAFVASVTLEAPFLNLEKLIFSSKSKALESSSFPTAVAKNINQKCREDSQLYVRSLYSNRTLWALQMQESSAKLPPGLFVSDSQNVQADGLFDECLAVRAPEFDGQYCSVFFKPVVVNQSEILPPEWLQDGEHGDRALVENFVTIFQLLGIVLGTDRVEPKVAPADPSIGDYPTVHPSTTFCLPSSCSAADLGQAVAELIGSYVIANHSIVTITDEQYCFKANSVPPSFDSITIIVIEALSLVGLLVLMATVHEAWRMYRAIDFNAKKDGKLLSALHCFSALNNGRKILSMKVTASSSNDNFGCIHGIRFFSTCWVVMGNTFYIASNRVINRNVLFDKFNKMGIQSVVNLSVINDNFFLIGGLLTSFQLLRDLDRRKGKFNVGLYYLHRYLRLTIVYAFILGFVATLIVYVGTGPNWYTVNLYSNACRNAWWRQFLYINNLFPLDPDYMCMRQTWYLAVDMQLFFVSPLLIYPLWRWWKFGLVWLVSVAVGCYTAIFFVYAGKNTDIHINDYRYKPWIRAPPYLVGILAGWLLHITKQTQSRPSKLFVGLGWSLSLAVGAAVIHGLEPNIVHQSGTAEISLDFLMAYGPLHRTIWACVVAWIIIACSRGYGGFVNRLLSWKGFLPLSRLTYCVYLIHYDYLNVFYSAVRKRYYYRLYEQFVTLFGILFVTFALAFMISASLEVSFLRLEKLIFSSKPKRNSLPASNDRHS